MDYRKKIIELLSEIHNGQTLKFIYWITESALKREKAGE